MLQIKELDYMMECPCGIVTNQAIVWDYPAENFRHEQIMCHTCQKELLYEIARKIKNNEWDDIIKKRNFWHYDEYGKVKGCGNTKFDTNKYE